MTHREALQNLKVGDTVTRQMGYTPPYCCTEMIVTRIDEDFIHCGPWTFSRETGREIDEILGWDKDRSGSSIMPPVDWDKIINKFMAKIACLKENLN